MIFLLDPYENPLANVPNIPGEFIFALDTSTVIPEVGVYSPNLKPHFMEGI